MPPLATMAVLSASLATAHRWLHSLLPRAPGKAPGRHVGGCAGARVHGGSFAAASALPRSLSCRVRELVAHRALPGRVARRGKFLEMPWLAFPARLGALSPWLEYFVLEWLQRNHGGPWRSPGKPCRGTLRLPVHKFGILGYPYSSTPTKINNFYKIKPPLCSKKI